MQRPTSSDEPDARDRVLAAALTLLEGGGRHAVTTRAVAAAAGVAAPVIYRLFGDMQGLIDALAEHGFERYMARKRPEDPALDPIDELRLGWDVHVAFGLENPAIFVAMYGDPRPDRTSPAAARALAALRRRVHAVARAGRLRFDERRAADAYRAAACGVVMILLERTAQARDLEPSRIAREALIAAITVAGPAAAHPPGAASAATALRALLPDATVLSDGERRLLIEWLDRLAQAADDVPGPA